MWPFLILLDILASNISLCFLRLLDGGFKTPKQGKNNDNSHPPIHPTKYINPASLQDNDQRRLYELITRHFLACCSDDALGSETIIEFDINGEVFIAKGLMVREMFNLFSPFNR